VCACVLVCSAGVGRTGVLIGMLTACSCIEAGLAVDMLAIVRQMRDQRAILIQTQVTLTASLLALLSLTTRQTLIYTALDSNLA